jgi:hypothetical protein
MCAKDIFRKQADQDYIAARSNFRMELRQQFLWSAQQTIEKYLKAILLFNGKTARFEREPGTKNHKDRGHEFGHNLLALHSAVKSIEYLNYSIPEWGESFMEYLTDLGGLNRYLSKNSSNTFEALGKFDELVWYIRRYCQPIPENTAEIPYYREAYVENIHSFLPPKYANLSGGILEKILDGKRNSQAELLLKWNNEFFCDELNTLPSIQLVSSFEIPPQEREWFTQEMKQQLKKYIKP